MPERELFEYAIVRVMPHVQRGELVNAGVILLCHGHGFLAARIELDEPRLLAIAPDADLPTIRAHLGAIERIARGDAEGEVSRLPLRERFAWLVAPRSTAIRISRAHAGLCDDPERILDELVTKLVRPVCST